MKLYRKLATAGLIGTLLLATGVASGQVPGGGKPPPSGGLPPPTAPAGKGPTGGIDPGNGIGVVGVCPGDPGSIGGAFGSSCQSAYQAMQTAIASCFGSYTEQPILTQLVKDAFADCTTALNGGGWTKVIIFKIIKTLKIQNPAGAFHKALSCIGNIGGSALSAYVEHVWCNNYCPNPDPKTSECQGNGVNAGPNGNGDINCPAGQHSALSALGYKCVSDSTGGPTGVPGSCTCDCGATDRPGQSWSATVPQSTDLICKSYGTGSECGARRPGGPGMANVPRNADGTPRCKFTPTK